MFFFTIYASVSIKRFVLTCACLYIEEISCFGLHRFGKFLNVFKLVFKLCIVVIHHFMNQCFNIINCGLNNAKQKVYKVTFVK